MDIGVIGSGDVGRRLADGLISLGHNVMLATRNREQEKIKAWHLSHPERAAVGSPAEAAKFGTLIVLATPWSGTEEAIRLAGAEQFAGKIVIDVTNPLDFSRGMPPRLALGHTDSGGEQVARWLPKANVVKAFNIVGNTHMIEPEFGGLQPTMFIAGNDDSAKQTVTEILTAFGWETIDLGDLTAARYLEPLAMVWITYGFKTNTWNHAFKLLKK